MIEPTSIPRFIYDNEDILLELDGSNNITARYTHGPGIDEPLIVEKSGQSFFYHADGLGSITELTDVNGSVVKSYSYSSFGRIENETNPTFIQLYTFTSREFDPESGLYYYRARHYDPSVGRFLQEDPIRFLSGPSFYPYTGNNPLRYQDPSGQAGIGALVGAGLGLVSGVMGAVAQNGTAADIVAGALLGAATGAVIGAIDPSEGILTTMALAGGIGAIGNLAGQTVTAGINPLITGEGAEFDFGSLIGSGIGSAIGAGMGQIVATGFRAVGASEFISNLAGGLMGLTPSALGGPIGSAAARSARSSGQEHQPQAPNYCPLPRPR